MDKGLKVATTVAVLAVVVILVGCFLVDSEKKENGDYYEVKAASDLKVGDTYTFKTTYNGEDQHSVIYCTVTIVAVNDGLCDIKYKIVKSDGTTSENVFEDCMMEEFYTNAIIDVYDMKYSESIVKVGNRYVKCDRYVEELDEWKAVTDTVAGTNIVVYSYLTTDGGKSTTVAELIDPTFLLKGDSKCKIRELKVGDSYQYSTVESTDDAIIKDKTIKKVITEINGDIYKAIITITDNITGETSSFKETSAIKNFYNDIEYDHSEMLLVSDFRVNIDGIAVKEKLYMIQSNMAYFIGDSNILLSKYHVDYDEETQKYSYTTLTVNHISTLVKA